MPRVSSQDIRRIIFENYNDPDLRFSNDEILSHLSELDSYKGIELDVLDFEDAIQQMEQSGMLRPIAQNFNTRYFRLWAPIRESSCKSCGKPTFFAESEERKVCPNCQAGA